MSEQDSNNIEKEGLLTHIDNARLKKLKVKGQYINMYESFDLLRTKFIYGEPMSPEEGVQLITLTKYFMENGHSEALKIVAKHIHNRYIKNNGL